VGQNDCGPMPLPKDSIQTCVVTFDMEKFFIIPVETLCLKDLNLLFIKQHKLWNDT